MVPLLLNKSDRLHEKLKIVSEFSKKISFDIYHRLFPKLSRQYNLSEQRSDKIFQKNKTLFHKICV